MKISLADISEQPDDAGLPWLDRAGCDGANLNANQLHWREHGYLILPGFIPEKLIEAYSTLRESYRNQDGSLNLPGWSCPTPYMHYRELRDICLYPPLSEVLASLIGEQMGLHLTLTGWVSTTRDWHQDDYLNPPFVNSWYLAVWFALDDISDDSGPFEFVPGSHRWPLLRRNLVWKHLSESEKSRPDWPTISERVCTPAFERHIQETGSEVKKFLGKRGDVLIWHGRLAHRGSKATNPNALRKGLVAHYSAVSRRPDMPALTRWNSQPMFLHMNRLDTNCPPATISTFQRVADQARFYMKAVPGMRHRAKLAQQSGVM